MVEDLIRGPVAFPNRSYDDFVIARGDDSVLYNFAVAVDDAEMGITDVVRGDDHLSNTPKQLLVLAALGHEPPRYAHLPLLHGPDGKKLSKRHGAASAQELREAGYLPAAVRNYLALLGWGTDDDTTLMSTEELVVRFRVEDVGRAAAIFDEKKLRWVNGRFMREMPLEEYTAAVASHLGREPDERLRAACEIAQEKAQTLEEVWPLIRFLFEPPVDDPKAWAKTMKEGTPLAARGGTRGARRQRGLRRRSRSRQRCPRSRTASASSPASSTSRFGSRSPAALSRRASSSRWPRWAARNPGPDRRRDRASCAPASAAVILAHILGRERLNRTSSAADDVCGWVPSRPTSARKRQGQEARCPSQGRRPMPGPAPGSRLADAFEAVERFPVLIESRERVMRAATAETARVGELVEAVESDVALTIAVLRFANRSGAAAGGVGRRPRGDRRAQALRRAGDRRHGADLRLLRVKRRLGAEARALPHPRTGHPARRR